MPEIALVGPTAAAIPLASALQAAGATSRVHDIDEPDLHRHLFGVRPAAAVLWLTDATQQRLDALQVLAERLGALAIPTLLAVAARPDPALQDVLRSVDDVVFTPVRTEEVRLRLRLITLRRAADAPDLRTPGGLTLEPEGFRAFIDGVPLALTYKEFELLRFLFVNRGRVLTRETILQHVWGYDFYGGLRTVDAHIRRLRAKIEPRAPGTIETIRNVGYRIP